MTLSQRLLEYVSACFTGLWIESHEHEDALREIAQMCRQGRPRVVPAPCRFRDPEIPMKIILKIWARTLGAAVSQNGRILRRLEIRMRLQDDG